MAAILLSGPNQGLHIVASVSSLRALQACPRHRYSRRAAQYIRTLWQIIDAPGSLSELTVFIALHRNTFSVTMPMCDVLLRHF